MKPPVEAPTSSAAPAREVDARARRARCASLMPPRETYGGGASTLELDVGRPRAGPACRRAGAPGPRCTSPAITAAAARVRDANSPRSASRESRRTRATAERYTAVAAAHRHSGCTSGHAWATVSRPSQLPIHSALELRGRPAPCSRAVACSAPRPAGLVARRSRCGALLVGMALAGPDALPITAHQSFDLMLVAALAGGGSGSPSPATRAASVLGASARSADAGC